MKWIRKQIAALVLGFLDSEKELRSTPVEVINALNIVTEFISTKYWKYF
ncbi:hypothetical protein [Blautia obeum]|nr:hypothetical protein [Blautia obeum]